MLLSVIYSCANMGTPNGGPYDEDPPKFISSTPRPNQTNFTGKKIEIIFDELIQLDNPSQNIIVTPPQMRPADIRANGKKIAIEYYDTLIQNTTYTIDFTSSIADNNEKNVLENFSFAFSTGNEIDTMAISGTLLNAANLEPMPGLTVGIHENLSDTAFKKVPFLRTSRTNDRGQFTIRNMKPGTYRVFALSDPNRNYMFDMADEEIAFMDSAVVPAFVPDIRYDTIMKPDSSAIDTIYTTHYNRFIPDDIILRLFKENFVRFMKPRAERPEPYRINMRFNGVLDSLPELVPLDFTPRDEAWYYTQPSSAEEGYTVSYWLRDSTVWNRDTLHFSMTYPLSDSLDIPRPQTDTFALAVRRARVPAQRRGGGDETPPVELLQMTINASSSFNVYDTLSVVFNEPVEFLEENMFFLEQQVDTNYIPRTFELLQDSLNPMKYLLIRPWSYEESFRLSIDSATICSIYGKENDKYQSSFTIKKREDYGHLLMNITGLDTTAFVDLLNNSDALVRRMPVVNGGALFMDLAPGKYYARIIIDLNQNGEWDTGKYSEGRQPEEVFYFSKIIDIPVNFEITEDWNINDVPLVNQKPMEITKNKPKAVTKPKRDYRNENRQQSSGRSSGIGGGMSGLPF